MFKKIFILIAAAAVISVIYFTNSLFVPANKEGKLVYFEVKAGESLRVVTDNLKSQSLIKNSLIFKIYAKLTNKEKKLIAGEHKLSAAMDVRAILKNLTNSKIASNERKITIIEGWRSEEMGDYLERERLVKKAEFLAAAEMKNWRQKYDWLKDAPADSAEGFLFPDTYRVFNNAQAEEIVKKMLDNFDLKLDSETREEIKKQNKNIFEVVTLASIVEREARTEEDKRMVADVFLKRLALNIGLQSDATINYLTGKNDLRPSIADTEIDSRYNTYKYRGLPPGPICNPGLAAIKAVIYPQKNDYYFFLMDKEGRTHYAKTYSEHLENIRKYLE